MRKSNLLHLKNNSNKKDFPKHKVKTKQQIPIYHDFYLIKLSKSIFELNFEKMWKIGSGFKKKFLVGFKF